MTNSKTAFRLLTSLFFMWGFITVMNDILINTFRGIFDLTPPQRALVQFAFFGAFFIISLIYFIISTSKGKDPINKIGYKNGMAISLAVTGLGCLLFYVAAQVANYSAFLSALFILASGVTLLQICANPYATILGDPSAASSRLNMAQGFNSLGTTLGPIVGTILIYKVFSDGTLTVEAVANTYMVYGLVFLLLSSFIFMSKMPEFRNTETIEPGLGVLKNRHLLLGVVGIFFYVGSEVSVGSWVVEFIKDERIGGLEEAEASYYLSYFWGGLMIGRLMAGSALNTELSKGVKLLRMFLLASMAFVLIYVMTGVKYESGSFVLETLPFGSVALYIVFIAINYLSFTITFNRPARALVVFCSINAVLLIVAITSSGYLAMWSILGTGLFFSIGWSNLFSLSIKGLGKYTSQGSALLVMAIVGGALIPGIQSFVIQSVNVQISFIIPLIGMIYLIYYGLSGHKIKENKI